MYFEESGGLLSGAAGSGEVFHDNPRRMSRRVVIQGKEDQALGSESTGKERKLYLGLGTLCDNFLKTAFELAHRPPRRYVVEERAVQEPVRGSALLVVGVLAVRENVTGLINFECATGDVMRGDHRSGKLFNRDKPVPAAARYAHPMRDERPRQIPPKLDPAPSAGYAAHRACRTTEAGKWQCEGAAELDS